MSGQLFEATTLGWAGFKFEIDEHGQTVWNSTLEV